MRCTKDKYDKRTRTKDPSYRTVVRTTCPICEGLIFGRNSLCNNCKIIYRRLYNYYFHKAERKLKRRFASEWLKEYAWAKKRALHEFWSLRSGKITSSKTTTVD